VNAARERLLSKVEVEADFHCWVWAGTVDHGSPKVRLNGAYHSARRLSWESWRGPIPKGKVLVPRCGNRLCINPDHLAATTLGVGTGWDGIAVEVDWLRSDLLCPEGHWMLGVEAVTRPHGDRRCRACDDARLDNLVSRVAVLDPREAYRARILAIRAKIREEAA
jgi:hypothetical protein